MNIVLIVTDTFRRDHLGCYGNEWIYTPHLDRFSKQAITFDRCYASSFPTMPMRADLFLGKYTFTYLGWNPLAPDDVTLAQLLTDAGYRTFGVTDTPFFVRKGYGYDRGFEDFYWIRGQRHGREDVTGAWRYEEDRFAPLTMAAAEQWLEHHYNEQFFLYVDTWDPHEEWDPPEYYIERYYKGYDGRKVVRPCYWDWKEAGLTKEELTLAHAAYCGEVTMVDRWVGRLLERIESLDLMDRTIIIFTADHGFYFGERGQFGKQRRPRDPKGEIKWYRSPLYDEVTRIPLMIYLPGARPSRSSALATPPDLMPTILQLAGVPIPETVEAPSLVPLLKEQVNKVHDFVVTSVPLYNLGARTRIVDDMERELYELSPSTITEDEWTLLYSVAGDPIELYHNSDIHQEHNVFQENHSVAKRMHQQFVQFLENIGTDEALLEPRRSLA